MISKTTQKKEVKVKVETRKSRLQKKSSIGNGVYKMVKKVSKEISERTW